MFHKLIILSLMQLSEKFRFKATTKQQKLGIAGKMFAKMGISYGIFVALFLVIFKVLFFSATPNLFIFFIFVLQLISIVSQTVNLSDQLYASKDNQILLTYPVKHIYVYISKLMVAYIVELYKSLLFVLPIFMAYMTINSTVISFTYIFGAVVFSLLLPLFPVLIGALLSIPLSYIKKAIKKYTIAKILALVALLVGLGFLTVGIIHLLPDQLRIVALYNSFLRKFNEFLGSVNKFSLYNQFIGYAMYGEHVLRNYLLTFAILIGLGAVSVLISMPLFFTIASSTSENAIIKKHVGKNVVHKSVFYTFLKKEFLLSIRNIGDFASDYLFLFIMPFVLPIMVAIFTRVDRNATGFAMTYGFAALIILILLSASSTAAATAISSEGTEFVLLKTAPSNTSKVVWSKLLINYFISFVMVTITFIILGIILKDDVALYDALSNGQFTNPIRYALPILYFVILIVDFGIMCWSIQLDIMKPSLKEYANSQKRSDVKTFSSSIMIGVGCAIVFALLIIVVLILKYTPMINALVLIGVAIFFALFRLYFLVNYTKYYFKDIEL